MSKSLDPLKITAQELPSIIIAGDSWACGEWMRNKNTHRGLEQYLKDDGYDVINLGIPNGSNIQSIRALKDCLLDKKFTNLIGIFYFWTEWHRDMIKVPYYVWDMVQEKKPLYFSLNKYDEYVISGLHYRLLTELELISRSVDAPVGIIGGCSDVIEVGDAHPGVYTACQSLTNLCINNDDKIDSPVFSIFADRQFIKEHRFRFFDGKALLLQHVEDGIQRHNLWQTHKEYFPDGYHANRIGHKKLFDLLKANKRI